MRLYGSLKELVAAVFRKDSQEITLRPNQSTTYTAARDIQLPPGDAAHVIVSANSTQTLTNKTFDADGTGNSISNIENADIKAAAAIDATKLADGSVTNTEFQYIGGLTSDAQTQLNAKITASSTDTLTNKTIDGDDNTVQDLPITAIKTVLGDANKVLRRDASGVPQSGNTLPNASAIVTTDATQTLTNKSFSYPSFTNRVSTTDGLGDFDLSKARPTGDFVGTTDTQVLTNKDIDGGTASNTSRITLPKASTATLAGLTRKEGTVVYDTDLDKPFYDNGSTLLAFNSGGSGSGEVNAISNPSASENTTGWTAATNYTVTRDTSNSPLSPVTTTCFAMSTTTASSESSTSGIYYALTLPTGLENTKLKLDMYCTVPSSSDGVWVVSVYDGTTRLNLSTDSSSVTTLPSGFTGKFSTTVDTTSNNTYTVSFTQTTRTNANTLYVTGLVLGPGIQPQGAVVDSWQSYTPGSNVTTNVTRTGRWRRVGDSMEIQAIFTFSGANTQNVTAYVELPSGYTINTSALPGSTAAAIRLGGVIAYNADGSQYNGMVSYFNTTQMYIHQQVEADPAKSARWNPSLNQAMTLASGDIYSITALVPISEWAGNGTVNLAQNDVEYTYNTTTTNANDTTAFGYGPNGGQLPNVATSGKTKRVRFTTPIQPTDIITLELSKDSGVTWWPNVLSDNIQTYALQNTTDYGVNLTPVNSTDVDVYFATYRFANGATFASAGLAWSGIAANSQYLYRVKKAKSGQAVGFGLASSTSAGLVNPYTEGSGVVYSGTYTPTLTNGTNIASSTSGVCQYIRIGNRVTVFGRITIDPTAGGNAASDIGISLPIASNLALSTDLQGHSAGAAAATNAYSSGVIDADTANDRAQLNFNAADSSSRAHNFSFCYKLI